MDENVVSESCAVQFVDIAVPCYVSVIPRCEREFERLSAVPAN